MEEYDEAESYMTVGFICKIATTLRALGVTTRIKLLDGWYLAPVTVILVQMLDWASSKHTT